MNETWYLVARLEMAGNKLFFYAGPRTGGAGGDTQRSRLERAGDFSQAIINGTRPLHQETRYGTRSGDEEHGSFSAAAIRAGTA